MSKYKTSKRVIEDWNNIICYCELAEWCDNPEHNEEVIYFCLETIFEGGVVND